MSRTQLIIFFILFFGVFSEECTILDYFGCGVLKEETDVPESYDEYAFQTPPRYDALGNYRATFQDMKYLVGWIEYNYNSAKNSCTVTFHTKVNPDLGVKDTDYTILYTFGEQEQSDNYITVNSKDGSYPNGMSVSCRIINSKTGNEVASLELQNIYFIWDNIEVNTPEEYKNGQRGAIVELFGWPMEDVGEECEFLGIAGYLGVKIFSPYESLLSDTITQGNTLNPWWYGTQVVSFKYDCRSGNQKQLKKIINRCRAVNVRVYAEIVVNHMTGDGNDMNPIHYTSTCQVWGPKEGSGGSPFYTKGNQISYSYYTNKPPANEYPSVPYFPSDFHCGRGISNWDDPDELVYGTLAGLQDLNTEKEYVRKRIATYIVDLLSLGVSGIAIANGRHITNISWAKILSYVKEYLGNKLPDDFMAIIVIEGLKIGIAICNENEGILDFGKQFTNLLKAENFKDSEILQIKLWFKGCLAYEDYLENYSPACDAEKDDELLINVERWTISLEYSDDINMGHDDYNIYIKTKNKEEHKNILINNMLLHPSFNHTIKFIFTSYSIDSVKGIPDGKSEKSFCSTEDCRTSTTDLPFKRAFNPHSTGYDCGDSDNWVFGEYSRIHRDIDIVNAMREWMYSSQKKNLTKEELYTKDLLKANCDEKCLICNEESKREDKCIFCDSNNDYYPVMESGGSEEYYQCYKKDAKVERLYFSNREKAFLPCYETCRYCNELGDINNHKCTACDYNLVKKPGTKDTATTFNCVTSCAYSYYYTDSGQYKCTNTPVCPSDKNIYIAEKQKCVSSCKDESPFIYLHNGNCVQVCPSLYIADDENNICKLTKISECTLGSRVETLATLYSLSMLNSFAKGYRDEYSYTDKHFTRITNPSYNIIIFKDFDCVKELGLDIPDLRETTSRRLETDEEDTCYVRVQKALNIDDNLIVVYIEEVSNVIAEKGYLLYNPLTGGKTSFETICDKKYIIEKEDITADEDSDNKMMAYIYLRPASQNADDSGPTSCDEGLAPLYRNSMIDYSKCLNKTLEYEGLYYDTRSDMFIPCHENCKYCSKSGSATENNCKECGEGYIKNPLDGRETNYNCVAECTYSYFYSSTGVYTCTPGPTCPKSYSYYIPKRKQCIDACKNDDTYTKVSDGNCVIECPAGKVADSNGICIEENIDANACSLSSKVTTLKNFEDNGGLDTLVTNYYEEYYYTDKHVSLYNSSQYDIIIYIQKSCLTELNINFPIVDFGNCYSKVQKESGLVDKNLIVVILKKIDSVTGRSSTTYSLYNPNDGTKLDAATICADEEIVVEENVLDILEESGINYENMLYLTDQNIDVFDSTSPFYTDICYEFESPNDRDITLEDRLETFYPNVSLCDSGCKSTGVNLTSMKAICSCTFTDISKADILVDNPYLSEVFEIISSSNIQVLKCMKYMFKKFESSVGGFLMVFCIILVICMGLRFYYKDLGIIKKYIIDKTTSYINYLNELITEEEEQKTNLFMNSMDGKISDIKSKNQNNQNSNIDIKDQKQDSIDLKNDILLLNKINNSREILQNKQLTKLKSMNSRGKDTYYLEQSIKEDFKEYLTPDIDDQEFEDIIQQDKRKFKEYFIESLNEKQLFLNTFNVQDNFRPTSLKMVLFILTLILYAFINALFYGDDEISEIYHIEGEDPFFGFLPRSKTRYIYSVIVGTIIGLILSLFFVEEMRMKKIFTREKKNIVNLKVQITKLTREIVIRYIAFFIFVLVLFIILLIYFLCFNYVYPHTQGDWVKSSIFLIILMQILSILVSLLETSLRFIAFKFKSEKIFRLSKLLD